MFINLLNHIREQREKQQYINALATVIELQKMLLKEFSDLQKDKATQERPHHMDCTCRKNFEGAIIKIDPNCPFVIAAHR